MSKLMKSELLARTENLFKLMNAHYQDWHGVVIVSKVNQYYFTGTMQDGLLLITKDGSVNYFVRRSFNRATAESLIDNIFEIKSYRDVLTTIGNEGFGTLYVETEIMPVAMYDRFKKHIKHEHIKSADNILRTLRSVKSDYELALLKETGSVHDKFLREIAPTLLVEGMSEAEYLGAIYNEAIRHGYQGFARFYMFQTEIVFGQISFGENSLYPTNFDGPGGMKGYHPVAPCLPSRERRLKKGDLVFVDTSFALEGYHTDKTQLFMFGTKVPSEVADYHKKCIDIETHIAKNLKEGNIACDVYNETLAGLDENFKKRFMGTDSEQVKFLGHGTGLYMDEFPVISPGFKSPLKCNMVLAIEPKYHILGVGTVGVEDTYVITKNGGEAITGGGSEIISLI